MDDKADIKEQDMILTSVKALFSLSNEEHIVRKMANLLHVPQMEFIKTKHQVKNG
jgi:uncharacterized tellurite resistance protein B-like protein